MEREREIEREMGGECASINDMIDFEGVPVLYLCNKHRSSLCIDMILV